MSRGVIVRGFVKELSRIAQDDKAMGKPLWNPELPLVISREDFSHPLAEGFAAFPKVDRHIEDLSLHHTDQFALGLLDLVMQATQHVFKAAAVVVLHELYGFADGFFKACLVEAFKKEASFVTEDFRFDEHDVGYGEWCCLHQNTFSLRIRSRY